MNAKFERLPAHMTGGFPRVLLVNGEPVGAQSSTGFTLHNLFGIWPDGQLAQVISSNCRTLRNDVVSYKLEPCDLVTRPGGRRFARLAASETASRTKHGTTRGGSHVLPLRWAVNRLIGKQVSWALDLLDYKLSREFWQWLRAYQPEVVYSMLGSPRIIGVAVAVCNELRIPLVPHFMDDWPVNCYPRAWLRPILARRMRRKLGDALRVSGPLLTISRQMADEYMRRYSRQCFPLSNGAADIFFRVPASRPDHERLVLSYIGNVGHGRLLLLRDVVDCVSCLRKDYNIVVEICASGDDTEIRDAFSGLSWVRIEVIAGDALLHDALCRATCLLHLDSFAISDSAYFRFSLSGKVPVLLAAGRPILAYGSPTSGTIAYLRETGTAAIVDKRDRKRLEVAIKSILDDEQYRSELSERGRSLANAHHKMATVQLRFQEVLSRAAQWRSIGLGDRTGDEPYQDSVTRRLS